MGVVDDNPQIKVVRVDLVDLGNANTKFSRTYIYDEDGSFVSFSDMDINGNAYTATANVEKEGSGTTNLNLGDLETVTTLIDNLDGTFTYTNENGVQVTFTEGSGGGGGFLLPTDIDTLAELNNIVTDATLIDTNDIRLSDARVPLPHTHTANEITDFDLEVSNNVDVLANTAKVSFPEAPIDGQQYARENGTWVLVEDPTASPFGTEAEDFIDTVNVNITTLTKIAAKTFTTATKPSGRYRIAMIIQLEGGSAATNYLADLRVNGTQVGLEMEEEPKDVWIDNRNMRTLLGYYTHTGPAAFNIQLFAGTESGTLTIHGVTAEVWRVS